MSPCEKGGLSRSYKVKGQSTVAFTSHRSKKNSNVVGRCVGSVVSTVLRRMCGRVVACRMRRRGKLTYCTEHSLSVISKKGKGQDGEGVSGSEPRYLPETTPYVTRIGVFRRSGNHAARLERRKEGEMSSVFMR